MQRNHTVDDLAKPKGVQENFTSTECSSDSPNSLNYFNSKFCDNSDSSFLAGTSTSTRTASAKGSPASSPRDPRFLATVKTNNIDNRCTSSVNFNLPVGTNNLSIITKNKFIVNYPTVISMNNQKQIGEKSLIEMGFQSSDIQHWGGIIQPHKPDLLELLYNMIKNYEKTNVQIKIADTTFNCHMMVLQCYSDFFMDLNNEQVVVLPPEKVTPQAFVMVYDWMLSSKPEVQRDGILELFNAAQYLKIKGLVDQCWVCLDDDERFCEDAAFLLYLEARKFGHELIQQLMLTRVCKFFLTLVASKEFLDLTPKEICTLLQSNSIGVNAETEVLMSAVRWLLFNWEEREKYLLDVMKCVRFGLMTPWQLVELRRNSDCPEIKKVVEFPEVQKMIDDGLSYVTTKYWYASNPENLFYFMERLNLTEPVERQWVCDKAWTTPFDSPNQMYSFYASFLAYLEMIRNMGKDHWRTLECHEGNPNSEQKRETISINDIKPKSSKRLQKLQVKSTDVNQSSENNLPTTRTELVESRRRTIGTSMSNESLDELFFKIDYDSSKRSINNAQYPIIQRNISSMKTKSTQSDTCYVDNTQRKQHNKELNKPKPRKSVSFFDSCCSANQMNPNRNVCSSMPIMKEEIHSENNGKGILRSTVKSAQYPVSTYETNSNSFIVPGLPIYNHDGSGDSSCSEFSFTGFVVDSTDLLPQYNKDHAMRKTDLEIERSKSINNDSVDFSESEQTSIDSNRLSNRGRIFRPRFTVTNCPMDKQVAENMKHEELLFSELKLQSSMKHLPRSVETILLFGGNDPIQLTDDIQKQANVLHYYSLTNKWKPISQMPEARQHHSAIYFQEKVYVIGGTKIMIGRKKLAKEMWSFDPLTNNWYNETHMPYPRRDFGLVATHLQFYVIGGEDDNGKILNSMLSYDPYNKIWKEKRPLNIARTGASAIKFKDRIWVGGGLINKIDGIITKSIECYDPIQDNWIIINDLRIPRCYACFGTYCNKIYIVGGAFKTKEGQYVSIGAIDCYDEVTGIWVKSNELKIPRHGHELCFIDSQMFIIGGVTTKYERTLNSVECFCIKRSNWIEDVADLPDPKSGMACIVLPPTNASEDFQY